jgi:hypothetical protein
MCSSMAGIDSYWIGTGGVSSWALKLARASGLRVILTSSSDQKLEQMRKLFGAPEIQTVNYKTNPEWHEEVLKLTDGVGVDLVIENGGASSLVKSLKCTRRGGIVSQVGYLGKQQADDLQELVPTIIDRRVILRYGPSRSNAVHPRADMSYPGASTAGHPSTWKTFALLSKPPRCIWTTSSIRSIRSRKLKRRYSRFGKARWWGR